MCSCIRTRVARRAFEPGRFLGKGRRRSAPTRCGLWLVTFAFPDGLIDPVEAATIQREKTMASIRDRHDTGQPEGSAKSVVVG
jgi:hypothetical protein